jgi:hypothetical protein
MELDKSLFSVEKWTCWNHFCKSILSMNSVPVAAWNFDPTLERLAFDPFDVLSNMFKTFIRDVVLVN